MAMLNNVYIFKRRFIINGCYNAVQYNESNAMQRSNSFIHNVLHCRKKLELSYI